MIQFFSLWLQRYSHVNWVLADQVMVSGLNFLTSVLLGRFLGVEGYGQFVLLYAVLVYVNIIQFALIIAPMMSIAPQASSDVERTNYFKGIISLQLLFSFLLSLIVFVFGSGIEKLFPSWNIGDSILPLALSILFFQLQDWLRRYYFICSKGKAVFINDLVSYGGQIALLFVFYRFGQLNLANAFWAIAVSSAIAFLAGALVENIQPVWAYASPTFKQSWESGRDLLFAGQINWVGSQGILLFGASILGAKAAGGIRAAQNIVGAFNILFQAMENIVPIRAAQHYGKKQLTGLTDYLKKVSLIGGLLLAVPCIAIALFSKELIELVYGKEYKVFSMLIVLQSLATIIGFFRIQFYYFFRSIGYTKEILLNIIVSSMLAFIFTGVFIYKLHETAIILALVLGEASGIIFFIVRIKKYLKKINPY